MNSVNARWTKPHLVIRRAVQGSLTETGAKAGVPAPVLSVQAPEYRAIASQAIAVVFADANGKVTDVDGGGFVELGVARTAAGEDGDQIVITATA